jgi:cellulose synthase/poly-beta-1,6-N-acetylglucosamine synthase-like glycosyltransferase
MRSNITPNLTMVIPAHNEADVIRRKLENSLSLNYPREALEILVIDDGSEDGTAEIAAEFADRGIALICQSSRQGKMAAVNLGVERAQGELIVLSDASPDYVPGALRTAVSHFSDPQVGVVSGQIRIWDRASAVEKPAGFYWRYQDKLRLWESKTGSTVGVNGNLFTFRRALYRPLPPDTINDEFTIAMQIAVQGYRVLYDPDAVTYDDASRSMKDEVKRRARINAGRYQALFDTSFISFKHPGLSFRLISHKLLRPLAPLFMIVLLAASLAQAMTVRLPAGSLTLVDLWRMSGWWLWGLLAGQALVYGLAALGWLFERQGWPQKRLLSVPYFFVSGNVAALVGLYRYLTRRQTVTWQKRSSA